MPGDGKKGAGAIVCCTKVLTSYVVFNPAPGPSIAHDDDAHFLIWLHLQLHGDDSLPNAWLRFEYAQWKLLTRLFKRILLLLT